MRLLPAVLLVSLALAGCASDGGGSGSATQTSSGSGMGMGNMTQPMDAAPMTMTVMMQNNAFSPDKLTIHVGDTVRWHTMDVQRHNVVSSSAGNEFRSSDMSSANVPNVLPDTFEHKFTQVGHVDYQCDYHLPGMVATIEVVPANQTIPDGGL